MFPASVNIKDSDGNLLLTSYAVHRPDGNWSLMLVNRDETNAHAVRVVFEDAKTKREASFSGPITFVTFGSDQYVWINDGPNSHADPEQDQGTSLGGEAVCGTVGAGGRSDGRRNRGHAARRIATPFGSLRRGATEVRKLPVAGAERDFARRRPELLPPDRGEPGGDRARGSQQ